ncbi:MAG: hypothetical protein JW940_16545 [Polyangiaceae bacterium]|nr:hypothetical protein [Polyangiaceae bacterium]
MSFSSIVVPAHRALNDLSPLVAPMYGAFEAGLEEGRRYFSRRRRTPDAHLFPHLVRYEALFHLAATTKIELIGGEDDGDEDAVEGSKPEMIRLRGLPNSGIQYRSSEYLVRAVKATPEGLVPPPRRIGGGRWAFLTQEEQGVFEDMGITVRPALRLVLLWHATPELTLARLSLACPHYASVKAVDVYWQVDLPRPVATVVEDLPIELLPAEATGTTGSADGRR